MALATFTPDPFAELGHPRTLDWLEQHGVMWDQASGVLPSIIIGVHRRASTLGQVTGYRQQSMLEDMTEIVLSKGPAFGVIPFDEGNRSGTRLAERKVAQSMIRALEAGTIDGIATPDAKRLSRDDILGGGPEIMRAVRARRAMLILGRGDVVNLRNHRERKQFTRELREAADEIGEIKYTFYSGWAARARKVAEGKLEPMFRGPAPFGYRHVECRDEHGDVIRVRAVARRTLEKHPDDAPGMAVMIALFESERSLNTVARKLNHQDIGRRIHRGALSKGWNAQRLQGLLENPAFYGMWRAIREKASDLWDDFDEADLSYPVPHLAYWTEIQARQWIAKFTASPVQQRQSTYQLPFLGILLCPSCSGIMTSAGSKGYRCRYASPQRQGMVRDMCRKPITIKATTAHRIARGLFEFNFAAIAERVVGEYQRQVVEQQVDPLVEELSILDGQETRLLDLVQGSSMSVQLRQRYEWIQERRAVIRTKQARQQPIVRWTEDQVQMIAKLRTEPLILYDKLTPDQQAQLWRLLGIQIRIEYLGGRGAFTRHQGEIRSPELLNDGSIWIVQGYLTGLKGIA